MLAAALLLSGLAVADRTIAWMIGTFPTSAALWELRFEYLRPIGVFHDLAVLNLGPVSAAGFSAAVLLFALAIGAGAISGIRLARALSCHVLLGIALVLTVYSLNSGEGVYAEVGVPSRGYVLIGMLLAIPAAAMCMAAHAEYVGWQPAKSRLARRTMAMGRQLLSLLADGAGQLIDQAVPSQRRPQAVFARSRRRMTAAVER